MECYACSQEATLECPRCGALYCDDHGDALCERCSDPALALPSYRVYRGSLLALLVGSVFAVWLLIQPLGGSDLDAPPPALAGALAPAPATPAPTVTPDRTPVPATPTVAVETPTPTPTPEPTPVAEAAVTEHVIAPGETMFAIAERYVVAGTDITAFVEAIASENGIVDVGLIAVGDVLRIPAQ